MITATYSVEDNKLRVYPASRLDDDLYQRVRGMGFKWAPKQGLFVAPAWTPAREDFCVELAGEVTAEQTTLVERAEAKAERLEALSSKRSQDANTYAQAANAISQRFAAGQPILMGHHSQRKAERDRDKMQRQLEKSAKAAKLSNYWLYRADGVEHHANWNSNSGVRLRRIKKLLADLRGFQRAINHSHKMVKLWDTIGQITDHEEQHQATRHYCGGFCNEGHYSFKDAWSQLSNGELTANEVIERSIKAHQASLNRPHYPRWILHTLNRLGYERSELGNIALFNGDLTAAILQVFVRTHGADKPKATKQGEAWTIKSPVCLPLHLANSDTLTLTVNDWCALMHSCGYSVPLAKPSQAPILNFKAASIMVLGRGYQNEPETFEQVEMTKADYKALNKDQCAVRVSACGEFRVKVYYGHWSEPKRSVFLNDSKIHGTPVSESVILDQSQVIT